MDNYTVYMHISPSGKKYIGITGQSVERRWGNSVGVNLNTACQHLLTYVSGSGPTLAKNIVDYRRENGAFASRACVEFLAVDGPAGIMNGDDAPFLWLRAIRIA